MTLLGNGPRLEIGTGVADRPGNRSPVCQAPTTTAAIKMETVTMPANADVRRRRRRGCRVFAGKVEDLSSLTSAARIAWSCPLGSDRNGGSSFWIFMVTPPQFPRHICRCRRRCPASGFVHVKVGNGRSQPGFQEPQRFGHSQDWQMRPVRVRRVRAEATG
jgi:hypothetical protein